MMLYLHIPYCESKCPYCAFNSFIGDRRQLPAYRDAAIKQLEWDLQRFKVESISSLYIGGGTPSVVSAELLAPLLARITPRLRPGAEATIEANPSSFSPHWGEAVRKLGINRLSLGVQSFNGQKLQTLGRRHSPQEAIAALEAARSVGFECISVDLIYGVQGDTLQSLKADLALAEAAHHISAYMLTLEPNTPFEARQELVSEDEELLRGFGAAIEQAGYPRYEVAAFGPPSSHNSGYWAGKPYLGIGCGAVGCVSQRRYMPSSDLLAYLNDPLFCHEECIDPAAWQMERVMLGLRCFLGIQQSWLQGEALQRTKTLIAAGKLTLKGDRIYNPDYLIADAIALYLLEGV